MKVLWIWLGEMVAGLPPPRGAAERLTLAGVEVEGVDESGGEPLLDLQSPPNRPDLLGHWGVARELAALLDLPLRLPATDALPSGSSPVRVAVEDVALCSRYTALLIEGVRVAPAPPATRRRLERLGVRSVSNVVDATNYVMLETGQPLHAFDADRIEGDTIFVRSSRGGERIRTLDGVDRTLPEGIVVVADRRGPIAIAGILGGAETQVTPDTRRVILESARFDPPRIRRGARRLGLTTDASFRFERGVDRQGVPVALARVARRIAEEASGRPSGGAVDAGGEGSPGEPLRLRGDRLARVLGVEFPPGEVESILKRLGCRTERDGGGLSVRVPSWRGDLEAEIDLIEEVARLAGYDRVEEIPPRRGAAAAPRPAHLEAGRRAALVLADAGFTEVMTSTFVSPQWLGRLAARSNGGGQGVRVQNPMAEDQGLLRTSLLPGLLDRAAYNVRRQAEGVRIFDSGKVHLAAPPGPLPEERLLLAGVALGPRSGSPWPEGKASADFFEAKGVVEALLAALGLPPAAWIPLGEEPGLPGACVALHPGRRALARAGERSLGWVGELAPEVSESLDLGRRVAVFELDLEGVVAAVPGERRIAPPPRYPAVTRDFAWWVPRGVAAEELRRAIAETAPSLIEEVRLFDYYEGREDPARPVSLAFRVRFRSEDRTLEERDVRAAVETLTGRTFADRFNASLRREEAPAGGRRTP